MLFGGSKMDVNHRPSNIQRPDVNQAAMAELRTTVFGRIASCEFQCGAPVSWQILFVY
jgi:hypothetical protein